MSNLNQSPVPSNEVAKKSRRVPKRPRIVPGELPEAILAAETPFAGPVAVTVAEAATPEAGEVVAESPAELGKRVTLQAIRHYRDSMEFQSLYDPRIERDEAFDPWNGAAVELMGNARETLLVALLSRPIEGDPFIVSPSNLPRYAMKSRGVTFEGKTYLAVHEPDDDTPLGEQERDGYKIMRLVVVDSVDILDLDGKGGCR